MIFGKGVHLLAYADEVDIIWHTKWDVTPAISGIKHKSSDMDLVMTKGETKYMLLRSMGMSPTESQITPGNYNIDVVNKVPYLSLST